MTSEKYISIPQSRQPKKKSRSSRRFTCLWSWLAWTKRPVAVPTWCFRLAELPEDVPWIAFSRKNQNKLWKHAQSGNVRECLLQEKALHGQQFVRVMIQEKMAFVMDPEWENPIVYDIDILPRFIPTWKFVLQGRPCYQGLA